MKTKTLEEKGVISHKKLPEKNPRFYGILHSLHSIERNCSSQDITLH